MNVKHYCCWKSLKSYYKRLGNLLKLFLLTDFCVLVAPEFPSPLHTLPSFLLIFCHFSLDCALYEIEGRGEDENVLHSIIIPLHMSPAWHIPYYLRKGMYLSFSAAKDRKNNCQERFRSHIESNSVQMLYTVCSISYNINRFRQVTPLKCI